MALQEVLNSSIWVIKDDKSNYQPLYGQFLYALNTDASGDDDKGMLYVGNGTEWINVMGTALPSIVENILATVPFEQIDNKTIFDAINEKANKATTLEGYGIEDAYTKTTIDAIILALEAELAGKQDKLTAGNNISIDGNKISVTGLTKSSVGLDQVDNTSDTDKPISTATQTALDLKADKSQVANISTDENTTKIQGNLEVSEVDTGETGSVITGTLVAHGQVDVDSISVGASSPLDSVSTNVSVDSKDTEIPTAKSVYSSVSLRALNDASNLTANNINAWKGKLGISDIETEVANKADKATTLGGYGITDAKIADGTITLGENSIIPLTASSDISGDKVKGIVAEATKATQDGDGNVISETYATTTVVEGKQDKLSAGANITIDENTNTISATDTTYTAGTGITIENNVISVTGGGGGSGTVKSVNNVEPGDDGNVSLTTANIPDLGISEDGTTITIGDKSIEPLTTDSTISANKIEGVVAEAIKATQDGNGNVISTTYAKAMELDSKQNKLTAGNNITIDDATNTISAKDTTYTAGTNITISASNEISATDTKYTAGTNISISDENDISVTGLTKASVGLGNVDNTSDADKPVSTATQTALNAKQDIANLVTAFGTTPSDEKYPSEKLVNDALNQTNQRVTGVENDTQTLSTSKQDKLKAGTNITITGSTISSKDTTYTAGTNISISNANAISVTGVYTSEEVDEKLATKADTSSLNDKQNKLTAGTNITIDETTNTINATDTKYTAGTNIAISDENAISVTGLTKASVGLGNVDNTSDANKPISTATQSALDGKQNKLTAGANITISDTNEISATDTKYTAGANISISNANAIAVTGVYTSEETDELLADKADKTAVDNINTALNSKADKATTLAGYDISDAKIENGTITLGDNTIAPLTSASEIPVDKVTGLTKASVGLGNVDNTSDANKPISTATQTALDAKQDISNLVTTIDSTSDDTHYPSAKAVYDYAQASVTSTVETTVTPTTAQMATVITGALAKKARVVVIPSLANVGAIYIKESDTYSSVNPIYPDPTNNMYEFTNMQNVKVFVDSVGDSVDLVIEYRG